MSSLDVVFSPAARREIRKFDRGIQLRFIEAAEALGKQPRPRGCEKVKGHPCFYRVKAGGDHRVIYHVLNERVVVILVLRDRKDAYRGLGDLDDKLESAIAEIEEQKKSARTGK